MLTAAGQAEEEVERKAQDCSCYSCCIDAADAVVNLPVEQSISSCTRAGHAFHRYSHSSYFTRPMTAAMMMAPWAFWGMFLNTGVSTSSTIITQIAASHTSCQAAAC